MADERASHTTRTAIVSDVDRMCRGDTDPPVAELSDRAALLVACGLTEPRITATVLARLHQGRPFPTVGGFHQIRVIEEQRHEIRRLLESAVPSMLRMALRTRLADLDRRYLSLRTGFTRGGGVFAVRLKDVRAERKRGTHMDTEDRGRLFDALASTPTMAPVPLVPRTIAELGSAAAARGQREMGRVVLPPRMRSMVDSLPQMPQIRADRRRIPEMYTAMAMEVGGLYDRLLRAYVRGGRAVDEVRLQVDAESESVGLSGELCPLREAAGGGGPAAAGSPGSGPGSMTCGPRWSIGPWRCGSSSSPSRRRPTRRRRGPSASTGSPGSTGSARRRRRTLPPPPTSRRSAWPRVPGTDSSPPRRCADCAVNSTRTARSGDRRGGPPSGPGPAYRGGELILTGKDRAWDSPTASGS